MQRGHLETASREPEKCESKPAPDAGACWVGKVAEGSLFGNLEAVVIFARVFWWKRRLHYRGSKSKQWGLRGEGGVAPTAASLL